MLWHLVVYKTAGEYYMECSLGYPVDFKKLAPSGDVEIVIQIVDTEPNPNHADELISLLSEAKQKARDNGIQFVHGLDDF